ncbi:MAG: aminoacetone oxidase family FAD-binding enzyme, partial [bacterium]|nr:aminoacetone oxidase family FAD-binding enzyme [bacterium]
MRIAIIGGGAAGMMAATTVNEANPQDEVFLLEKNPELGKKVIISGGGRCNVTTGIENVSEVIKKYPRGGKFLQSAMYNFSPTDVRTWFEGHNVPLKCEDDNRVFPVSDDGHDIVSAFKKIFDKYHTHVMYKCAVTEIEKNNNEFIVKSESREPLHVDRVVLALGGQAYRHTGSTGDGYSLAEKFGHTITALAPSLSSFMIAEKWIKPLAGVSFLKATITANGLQKQKFTGPFLFTHIGISGPAVFALSALVAFESIGTKKSLPITIDMLPDKTAASLLADFQINMQLSPKKSFKNTFHHYIPLSLAEAICTELKIALDQKNSETSKQTILKAINHT